MTVFVGIDPAARKIACIAYDDITQTTLVQAKVLYKAGSQTTESMGVALDYMLTWSADAASMGTGDKVAYVELPVLSSRGVGSTVKQSHIRGIICGTLVNAGFSVYGVNVQTWKKDICGNGHSDKADVGRVVRIKWPKIDRLLAGDGDLTDAAAITLYARLVSSRASAIRDAGSA